MGASRNQESTRQEKDGVVYYDRGILTGKDGRRYQRYAIKTHFVQPGEDQADRVLQYQKRHEHHQQRYQPWPPLAQ